MHSNFLLGKLNVTEAARMKLKRVPFDLVARHAVNDHGKVTSTELKKNLDSLKHVGMIMSRYQVDPTNSKAGNVIVVTSEDWQRTTVMTEHEYNDGGL